MDESSILMKEMEKEGWAFGLPPTQLDFAQWTGSKHLISITGCGSTSGQAQEACVHAVFAYELGCKTLEENIWRQVDEEIAAWQANEEGTYLDELAATKEPQPKSRFKEIK